MSVKLKTTIEVELQPFTVPDKVYAVAPEGTRQGGFVAPTSFWLSDLDADTLDTMCNEFRREVFKRTGKKEPPRTYT